MQTVTIEYYEIRGTRGVYELVASYRGKVVFTMAAICSRPYTIDTAKKHLKTCGYTHYKLTQDQPNGTKSFEKGML